MRHRPAYTISTLVLRSLLKLALDYASSLRSKTEARAVALLPASLAPAPKPVPLTFGAYAEKWLKRRVAEGLRSEIDYRCTLDNHVLPALGHRPLTEITTREIREFLSSVRAKKKADGKPLANRTVRNVYAITRNVLQSATADEILDKNPCKVQKSDLPKNTDAKADFRSRSKFDRAEVALILDLEDKSEIAIPRRWRVLYRTLFLTGARIGELLGLDWAHVLFSEKPLGKILIAKSWSSKAKRMGATKTNIAREVPIHPQLEPTLRAWFEHEYEATTGAKPTPEAPVFPRPGSTKPMRNTVVLHRFHHDLDRLGLYRRRVHDARRTFITLVTQTEGVQSDIIRRVTHCRPGDVFNAYREVSWDSICRELEKFRI